jgi:hypothetical protein
MIYRDNACPVQEEKMTNQLVWWKTCWRNKWAPPIILFAIASAIAVLIGCLYDMGGHTGLQVALGIIAAGIAFAAFLTAMAIGSP